MGDSHQWAITSLSPISFKGFRLGLPAVLRGVSMSLPCGPHLQPAALPKELLCGLEGPVSLCDTPGQGLTKNGRVADLEAAP